MLKTLLIIAIVFAALLALFIIPIIMTICGRIFRHVPTPSNRPDHWLYGIIPGHRALTRWYTFPAWAVYGNDDDGIFGETYVAGWYAANGSRPSLGLAARWWRRNPLYNLCTRVINWPREWVLVGCGWYGEYGDLGPQRFYWKPQFRWLADGYPTKPRQGAIVLWPPYLMHVGERYEWYLGWGSKDGRLGGAFRNANSRDAADVH